MKRITWKIEKRKLADLKPHSKNPRQFTEKGLKDLENSINSIGFMQPININQDGVILSGHARTLKLKEMGETEVDVYVPDRMLTPKQEEEVLVRANANTAGKWDWDLLANNFELEEINDWGLEVPDIENMPDLSILDDNDNNDKLNELADGVKKAIMIEFEPDHYQEAYDLIKYWREKELYVGKYLIDKLKQEKENE
jgi:ParB-like chromosome segregation protein Spo0J